MSERIKWVIWYNINIAIQNVDPYKTFGELENLICRCYEVGNIENIEVVPPRDVNIVIKLLQSGLLKQSAPSY